MSLTEEVEKLKRYDFYFSHQANDAFMTREADGEYLKYDEVLKLVESYVYNEDEPEDYQLSLERTEAEEKRDERLSQVADLARHIERIDTKEQATNFIEFVNLRGEAFILASALSKRLSDYEEEKAENFFSNLGKKMAEQRNKLILQGLYDG